MAGIRVLLLAAFAYADDMGRPALCLEELPTRTQLLARGRGRLMVSAEQSPRTPPLGNGKRYRDTQFNGTVSWGASLPAWAQSGERPRTAGKKTTSGSRGVTAAGSAQIPAQFHLRRRTKERGPGTEEGASIATETPPLFGAVKWVASEGIQRFGAVNVPAHPR